jgi:hypothetical protein
MVDVLADAGDELRGALADPRPEAHLRVVGLPAHRSDLASPCRIGHDDESLALAEPSRRGPLREPRDRLDRLMRNGALFEATDGPALHHDFAKFHGSSLSHSLRIIVAYVHLVAGQRPVSPLTPGRCRFAPVARAYAGMIG